MTKKPLDSTYRCVAENYFENIELGYCGDVRTLRRWLAELYKKPEEFFEEYFEGYSEKEITEYIYKNCGKRLEKIA